MSKVKRRECSLTFCTAFELGADFTETLQVKSPTEVMEGLMIHELNHAHPQRVVWDDEENGVQSVREVIQVKFWNIQNDHHQHGQKPWQIRKKTS